MTTTTKTYVEVVNDAIQESGSESATFSTSGSDFNTRTDKYMNLFKTWVQRAWRDIQIECYDWEFMGEQGLCTLNPGIMMYTDGTSVSVFEDALVGQTIDVYDQDGTVAISQISITGITDLTGNYTLTQPFMAVDLGGYSSSTPLNIALKPGAEYIISTQKTLIITPSSVSGTVPTAPFTCDITLDGTTYTNGASVSFYSAPPSGHTTFTIRIPSQVANNALLVESSCTLHDSGDTFSMYISAGIYFFVPDSSVTNKAYVHSWRSYDFNEEIQTGDFQEDIEEINQKTFRSIVYLHAAPTGELPIPFMPWEQFRTSYDLSSAYPGSPRLITEDNTGRYRFYPALYYPFSVKFDYVRRPQIVADYDDVFRGITDEFADLVMWRAINYYGEYMEQPSIITRSERRYKDLLSRLEQKSREKFHFKPKKLW